MNDSITVDQHFLRVGEKSYALAGIASVEIRTVNPGRSIVAALVLLVGGLVAAFGLFMMAVNPAADIAAGLFVALVGGGPALLAWSYFAPEPVTEHRLYLVTGGGTVQAITSPTLAPLQDLRDSLEYAIALRGQSVIL